MKRHFSLDTLMQAAGQCARRFPVTLVFVAALTVYLLLTEWMDNSMFSHRVNGTVVYYFAVGILLTAVLQLWGEEVKGRRTRLVTGALAHVALLADASYIYAIYDNGGMEVFLMHASLLTALALCLFILPFFRERDDVASWNFTLRIFGAASSSWLIGGIMCGGLCLLTAAIEQLFGIDLPNEWITTWCILFLITLPALLFLGRIPAGEEKHDRTPLVSVFLHKSIRYLFLPLLGCYLLVLYGYLAKILFQWQLPDGWVSKLVSVLTFGCIGVVMGLYPSLRLGTSGTDRRVVRWLPLAILPLLVLMTVGVGRRLADYGITVNRLYLLTLTVWYYVACIGLFLSRARRVWWIPASFAFLFLLTSALPVNVVRFTRNWMHRSVESCVTDVYKGCLPMSEDAYFDWLNTLPIEDARQINSRFQYLDTELRDTTISALVSDSVNWWRASRFIEEKAESQSAEAVVEDEYIYYESSNDQTTGYETELPASYTSMLVYTKASFALPRPKNQVLKVPLLRASQPIDTVDIRMSDLHKWNALGNFSPRSLPCHHQGNSFVLTAFSLRGLADSRTFDFTYSGYYLMQSPTESKQINSNE